MSRRSAWARQDRASIRALVRKYSASPVSKEGQEALLIKGIGIENASREQKIKIVASNPAAIVGEITKLMEKNPKLVGEWKFSGTKIPDRKEMINRLRDMSCLWALDGSAINNFSAFALHHALDNESKQIPKVVYQRTKGYLREREIPIITEILEPSLIVLMRTMSLTEFLSPINLAKIEDSYLSNLKSHRSAELYEAEGLNQYMRRVCKGFRFTARQRNSMKKWVRVQMDEMIMKGLKGMTKRIDFSNPDELRAHLEFSKGIEEEMVESARSKFSKEFQQAPATKPATKRNGTTSPTKIGTRDERIANYVPREKSPALLRIELDGLLKAAKEDNVKFDAGAYCLSEIARQEPETAEKLRTMLKLGTIKGSGITALFTSGSLTRRLFILVSENQAFTSNFGGAYLNVLAKGLAFIGSKGKRIEKARNGFQTPRRNELFKFLENNSFLDTGHAGGKVAYLARSFDVPQE